MDVRLGHGFDVHAFKKGNYVVLCGIKIPHKAALKGHSDADVALHAITDAIYGGLADGDIGRHFPPSDEKWKCATSKKFLRHAVNICENRGFEISNLDCTIICEFPKIVVHWEAMRISLSEITGISEKRISIKATTTEHLGFTGREEGIAAIATACLIKNE